MISDLYDHEPTVPSNAPVFVLASAQRCGSTLLQRLLNSRSDTLVWGEHNGVLNSFVGLHADLIEWESRFAGNRRAFLRSERDLFLPNMVPEEHEIRTAAKAYLVNLFALPAAKLGRPLWGFKEVRYGARVALFLQSLFPDARFVHLTRNLRDCFVSMKRWEASDDAWDRKLTERAVWDWVRINASLMEVSGDVGRLMSVRFEDMVSHPGAFIERLAEFLDVSVSEFDATVFDRRLHGQASRTSSDGPIGLDDEEIEFLSDPEIVAVATSYGYDGFPAK